MTRRRLASTGKRPAEQRGRFTRWDNRRRRLCKYVQFQHVGIPGLVHLAVFTAQFQQGGVAVGWRT